MDFYNCRYVYVIPGRYGNEYVESYRCMASNKKCDQCQCRLTENEADALYKEIGEKKWQDIF